jgi:cell division septation protein DedD
VNKETGKNSDIEKHVEKKTADKKATDELKKKEKPSEPNVIRENFIPGKEYYYIIVKGIAPEKELQRFLKDLQSKGYSASRLLEKNGKQRVSIMEFQDKSKADSALRQVKKTWQDAWILKQ